MSTFLVRVWFLIIAMLLFAAALFSCSRNSSDTDTAELAAEELRQFRQEMLTRRNELDKMFPFRMPSQNAHRAEVTAISPDGIFYLDNDRIISAEGLTCDARFYAELFQDVKDQSAYIIFESEQESKSGIISAKIWVVHQLENDTEATLTADVFENAISSGRCRPTESASESNSRYLALRREYSKSNDDFTRLTK